MRATFACLFNCACIAHVLVLDVEADQGVHGGPPCYVLRLGVESARY